MSWTPTDEQVEKAAQAMADDWNPDRDPILTAMFRDYANTVLVAVGPTIAASALRDAVDPKNATWPRGMYGSPDDMFARRDLLSRADRIEKEAGR